MGKIQSADTIYAVAYLTEKGRTYLFNKNNVRFDSSGNDLFEIKTFTLSDPDSNYNTSQRLESGDIPDITGKSDSALKTTADYSQSSLLYYTVDSNALANPLYSTNLTGNIDTINADIAFPVNSASDIPPTSAPGAGPGPASSGSILTGL